MNERELHKDKDRVEDKDKDRDGDRYGGKADRIMDQQCIWDKYILGELDEQQTKHAESLLVHDLCALEAYMTALSSLEETLPELQEEDAFIEALMLKLPAPSEVQQAKGEVERQASKRRIREHPLFNYVIAASITLFLLSFGVFDSMTPGTHHVVPPSSEPPLSERIMDKTSDWIDQLKP